VLYENAVSRNQAFVSLSGLPSELAFKRRDGFVMPFDRCHTWEHGTPSRGFPCTISAGTAKTGLNVYDEECLLHPERL